MITSLKTALAFTLDAASMLQTQQDKSDHMDQQAWFDVAEDLRKVALYCDSVGELMESDSDESSLCKCGCQKKFHLHSNPFTCTTCHCEGFQYEVQFNEPWPGSGTTAPE